MLLEVGQTIIITEQDRRSNWESSQGRLPEGGRAGAESCASSRISWLVIRVGKQETGAFWVRRRARANRNLFQGAGKSLKLQNRVRGTAIHVQNDNFVRNLKSLDFISLVKVQKQQCLQGPGTLWKSVRGPSVSTQVPLGKRAEKKHLC